MAGTIKGITIEIGGDTTKLQTALTSANKSINSCQKSLRSVEKALKLDPTNTVLLSSKQEQLAAKVTATKEKLEALKKAQATLDASGVDKSSEQYRELETQIAECEVELKSCSQELKNFGSVGAQQIAAVGEKVKSVGEGMKEVGSTLTQKVTVPLVAAGAVSVNKFAEVDQTLQLVNATMGNTADQAELIEDAMKEAAANSTYSMSDAATATLNFARAGLTAEEAANALAPAMNLAAGEGGDLDTVSQGLVATINGFGDTFDNASGYADVFANACNNSALDINSLSSAMSVAAPIFSAAGYSVNDAALYMGVMANAGIGAEEAATSLKTGLARLVSPTSEASEWLDKLGVSVTNADGSMKDSVSIQSDLHNAFSGLSESEQLAAASAIFGKNQMSNWLALINTAPEDVDSLSQSLETQGTTTEMADSMMSGFGGSLEKLKSSVDVAATSFGEALAPAISAVADIIQKAVDWFNGLDESQQSMIATIALVVAAIGPLLLIVGSLVSAIGSIMTFAPLLAGAGAMIAPMFLAVVAVIAAVVAAGIALYQNWDTIKEKAGQLKDWIGEKWDAIKEKCSEVWDGIKEKVSQTWDGIKETVSEKVSSVKETISEKWSGIKESVSSGMDRVKEAVSNGWDGAKTATSGALSAMQTAYNSHGGGISGLASGYMAGLKSIYGSGYDAINTATGGKLDAVKSSFSQKMQAVSSSASSILGTISGFFSSKLSGISSTVSSIMGGVKSAFTSKLEAAKTAVSGIISKIKGLFNFSLKLNLKVPHISVSGGSAPWGIGGKGSLPSFSVSWYDKGGIFDKPSIIGVGEKRPEFVGALDDLREIVREEAGAGGTEQLVSLMGSMINYQAQLTSQIQSMAGLLETYLPQGKEVYIDSTKVSKATYKSDNKVSNNMTSLKNLIQGVV